MTQKNELRKLQGGGKLQGNIGGYPHSLIRTGDCRLCLSSTIRLMLVPLNNLLFEATSATNIQRA